MVSDLRRFFQTDHTGTSLDKIPMLKDIKNVREMDLIVSVGSGHPVDQGMGAVCRNALRHPDRVRSDRRLDTSTVSVFFRNKSSAC